jgi:FPC/CPF motif-containing protein YcgG
LLSNAKSKYESAVNRIMIADYSPSSPFQSILQESETPSPESSYAKCIDGHFHLVADGRSPNEEQTRRYSAFRAVVQTGDYPCLGARSAINTENYRLGSYGELNSPETTSSLAHDLSLFINDTAMTGVYKTFAAIFSGNRYDENEFEQALWAQLNGLTKIDQENNAWDPTVSDDPADPKFAFSFGGTALFIIGLHPGASRTARQFAWPTIVFNPHQQFRDIRARGGWDRFISSIRTRDVKLQGSINPNLADHGVTSEAKQYSGRPVENNWKCPFHK